MILNPFIGDRVFDVIETAIVPPEEGIASLGVVKVFRAIAHQRMQGRGVHVNLSGVREKTRPEGPRGEWQDELRRREGRVREEEEGSEMMACLLRGDESGEIVEESAGVICTGIRRPSVNRAWKREERKDKTRR